MATINPLKAYDAYRQTAMGMVARNNLGNGDGQSSDFGGMINAGLNQFRAQQPLSDLAAAPESSSTPNARAIHPGPLFPQSITSGGLEKPGFTDLLRQGIQDTINANRHAEFISKEGVAGRADVSEVVTAIANAQESLSTLVTIRDKMIAAYQEIMRMPI